jgi:hypothetical protein
VRRSDEHIKHVAASSTQLVNQAPLFSPSDLTMSLRASACNTPKAVETVDAVDLTLPDNPNLQVTLFPISESTLYSTSL